MGDKKLETHIDAIHAFGEDDRIWKLMEEFHEFLTEVSHYQAKKGDFMRMLDERADVENMLEEFDIIMQNVLERNGMMELNWKALVRERQNMKLRKLRPLIEEKLKQRETEDLISDMDNLGAGDHDNIRGL